MYKLKRLTYLAFPTRLSHAQFNFTSVEIEIPAVIFCRFCLFFYHLRILLFRGTDPCLLVF